METKAHNPKVTEEVATKFIQFFTEIPKELNLPPDTFDKLIIELRLDPEVTIDALVCWLQQERSERQG